MKGIQAYRFAPPVDVLQSPKDNPANEGFCVPAGDCLDTGVLKVSVCREGEGPVRRPCLHLGYDPVAPASTCVMTPSPLPPPVL